MIYERKWLHEHNLLYTYNIYCTISGSIDGKLCSENNSQKIDALMVNAYG